MSVKNKFYFLMILLFAGVLFACNKSADTPAPVETEVGGATSAYKDTTTVATGNVVIKYSKTSQCYPSNEIFAFSATATGLPTGATYSWNFGDGHTANGSTVGNIYDAAGTYTVILTIKNSSGQTLNTASVSVAAWGQQVTPHAAFSTAIYDVNYVNNMTFTSSSTVQHGTVTNYTWDFGDGTITSTSNSFLQHNFANVAADRTYPVKLVVTANSGCKDTVTVPVSVAAVYAISGDFNIASYNACTNEYFVLTPTATGVPAGAVYTWDFADASGTATGNPVTHFFTYQNDYDVKMTITLNGKTIYQTNKWVHANGQNIKPKALFVKTLVSEDATSQKWSFYSAANIPHGYITGYYWDFGDGKTDNNFNTYVEDIYPKASANTNYTIKFIVTGNTGCKDTASGYITIPAK
jgi:PKD repeat protein